MENTEKPASADAPITQPRNNWWIRLIRYPKRKMDEHAAKKQKETPTDRAARITADATKWIAVFTFVSVAVSVGTFCILNSQLKEMHDGGVDTHNLAEAAKEQASTLKQQLAGTMAAIVTLQEPRVTPDQITGQMLLIVLLLNQDNRIMAQHVHLHFTSFPKTIQPTPTIIEIPQLSKSWSKNYVLANFTKQDEEFVTQKRDFKVEGTFGFDDGFGNKVEQPFCYSYLGRYNVRNEDGGGSTSGGNGFYTCDRFNELKAYLLKHPWK